MVKFSAKLVIGCVGVKYFNQFNRLITEIGRMRIALNRKVTSF